MKTYTLCGTPGYMAPEVILGQGYGLGSDWFSLGCVLYDMVTGAPPFPTRADQFTMIKTMYVMFIFYNFLNDQAIDVA